MVRPSTGRPSRQRGPPAPPQVVTALDTPTEASLHTAGQLHKGNNVLTGLIRSKHIHLFYLLIPEIKSFTMSVLH